MENSQLICSANQLTGPYVMATLALNELTLKVTSATKRSLLKMCHLKHRLRIFLFRRKIMCRSQNIQVFVFLTIP